MTNRTKDDNLYPGEISIFEFEQVSCTVKIFYFHSLENVKNKAFG